MLVHYVMFRHVSQSSIFLTAPVLLLGICASPRYVLCTVSSQMDPDSGAVWVNIGHDSGIGFTILLGCVFWICETWSYAYSDAIRRVRQILLMSCAVLLAWLAEKRVTRFWHLEWMHPHMHPYAHPRTHAHPKSTCGGESGYICGLGCKGVASWSAAAAGMRWGLDESSTDMILHGTIWYDVMWCGVVRCDVMHYDTISCYIVCYDMLWYDTIRYNIVCHSGVDLVGPGSKEASTI